MDRTELLWKLRDKFEALSKELEQPWASLCERFHEDEQQEIWSLCGYLTTRRTFEGLAKQAANVAKLDGLDGWLHHLAGQGGLVAMGTGKDGPAVLVISHLDKLAWRSMLAIDELLANGEETPTTAAAGEPAPPPDPLAVALAAAAKHFRILPTACNGLSIADKRNLILHYWAKLQPGRRADSKADAWNELAAGVDTIKGEGPRLSAKLKEWSKRGKELVNQHAKPTQKPVKQTKSRAK